MKILIIGLDGLEFTLVEKFDLKNLKQIEYGKTDLGGMFPLLGTPLIWASFITGMSPKKSGVTTFKRFESNFLERLKNIGVKMGLLKMRICTFPLYLFLLKIISYLGFKIRFYNHGDYDVPLMFDYARHPIVLNVPSYNIEPVDSKLQRKLGACFGEGNSWKKRVYFKEAVWRAFEERRKKAIHMIRERGSECDLLMFYWHTADLIGHLKRGDLTEMLQTYMRLDRLVRDLKNAAGEETFCLVVSDHGMKKLGQYGDHTNYGFYSCNSEIGLDNPLITDFVDVIQQKLRENDKFDDVCHKDLRK